MRADADTYDRLALTWAVGATLAGTLLGALWGVVRVTIRRTEPPT